MDTSDWAILTTFIATSEEYKQTLNDFIGDLTRHFFIAKLEIMRYRTKSKATTGVKNTASYIPWLCTACVLCTVF